MTLRGLRDDPVYQSLEGDDRASYEAAYRKTFAGQSDVFVEALDPLFGPVILGIDRLLRRWPWLYRRLSS